MKPKYSLVVSMTILLILVSCFRNQSSSTNVSQPAPDLNFANPIEQVLFFEDQAQVVYDQIRYGNDFAQEQMNDLIPLSTAGKSLRLAPDLTLKQFNKMIIEVAKVYPLILTSESVWLAEATQLVHKDQMDNVTDDLKGLFVIKMIFPWGSGDWVVAFIADLSTWELISWEINKSPSPETSYIPVDILYANTGNKFAYRRRVTESLSTQSLENPLELPIALLGNSPLEKTSLYTDVSEGW